MRLQYRLKAIDPLTMRRLRQIGVRDVCLLANCGIDTRPGAWGQRTIRFDAPTLRYIRRQLEPFDLTLSAICLAKTDLAHLLLGEDGWQAELDEVCRMIEAAGNEGVPVVQYALIGSACRRVRSGESPGYSLRADGAGGAARVHFDLTPAESGFPTTLDNASDVWQRIERFVERCVPVARSSGVRLACHPDDPPADMLWGCRHVLNSLEGIERFLSLSSDRQHGIHFCCGTFAAAGIDPLAALRRLLPTGRVHDVDLRNIEGRLPHYIEERLDRGRLDMPAIVRTLAEHHYPHTVSLDHVPRLEADPDQSFGQFWSLGYLKGLIDFTRPGGTA